LIGIDHFKQINDRYGHVEGDRILIEIAEVIRSTLRTVDIGARWGGEEFLITLYATDLAGAADFSPRIHQGLESVLLEGFTVHASVGVATVDLSLDSASIAIDHALLAADKALYQAKEFGRNLTVSAKNK